MNPSKISQLTLSTEDSLDHASHFLLQESNKGRKTKGSCGRSFRGWSQRLNLVGCWLKTYLESLPLPLIASARTWKVKATASGYSVTKLSLSVPRIRDHECSLLPTPTVNRNYNRKGVSKTSGDGLATVVRRLALLPTPTANDAKNNGSPSQRVRNSAALNVVAGGALNPEWVELLMGFPRGWTDIGTGESQK